MKRLALLFCLLSVFPLALAACGGGGGGGGAGGESYRPPQYIPPQSLPNNPTGGASPRPAPNNLSSKDETAKALLPAGLANAISQAGRVNVDSGGYAMLETNGNLGLYGPQNNLIVSFGKEDMDFYKMNNVGFAYMSKSIAKPDGFEGAITSQGDLWVGKLEHAAFGYWAQYVEGEGTIYGDQAKGRMVAASEEFYEGQNSVPFDGTPRTFTGVAAGWASYGDTNSRPATGMAIPLSGTASLTLPDSLDYVHSQGSLELSFPNFYKLTGWVQAFNSSLSGGFTDMQNQGSPFGNLPWGVSSPLYAKTNMIQGSLYGSAGIPTEAAGIWKLGWEGDGLILNMGGAFGAKQ